MRKKKLDKETYCLPIGIIPEWLLKAETGKGLWEHMIPDDECRKQIIEKVKERKLEKNI